MATLDRAALGQRVDEAIRASGVTQRALADRIGVSESQISRLVNAVRQKPNLELVWDIAEALEVPLASLLTGETVSAGPPQASGPGGSYEAIALAHAEADRSRAEAERIRAEADRLRVTEVEAVLQQTLRRVADHLLPLANAAGDAPAAAHG